MGKKYRFTQSAIGREKDQVEELDPKAFPIDDLLKAGLIVGENDPDPKPNPPSKLDYAAQRKLAEEREAAKAAKAPAKDAGP